MTEQDKNNRIISDLRKLSQLQAGKTLSISDMSIVDHNTWTSTFWRTYSGEDRQKAKDKIGDIIREALSVLETNPTTDLLNSFEAALIGIGHLKETYRGDYYFIAEINRIIKIGEDRLEKIKNPESKDDMTEDMWSNIVKELDDIIIPKATVESDQKICSSTNNSDERPKNAPNIEEVVEISNRNSSEIHDSRSIDSTSTKNSICGITGNSIPINKIIELTEVIVIGDNISTEKKM